MYVNLRGFCVVLAVGSMACGALGMAASFLVLASNLLNENIAGAAGFVAGAILIAAGLTAFTIAAVVPTQLHDRVSNPSDEGFSVRRSSV
jgi:Na+-translocating ferredoxin:NAD+ oxidoreductase RnfE subunit